MLRGILSPLFGNISPKPRLFCFSRYDSRLGASYVDTTNGKSETNHSVKTSYEIFSHFMANGYPYGGSYKTKYFHKVLERSPGYEASVFTETMLRDELCDPANCDLEAFNEQDLHSLSDAELVEIYRKVTSYAVSRNIPMTEDCITSVCTAVRKCVYNFSSENLITVGKLFALLRPFWKDSDDGDFVAFRDALDDACVRIYHKNHGNYILFAQMAELWYWSGQGSRNKYLKYAIGYCVARTREPQYLIQFLFYLICMKKLPPHFDTSTVEASLLEIEPVCTLDELALVCEAFSKTKTELQNCNFRRALLRRWKEGASDVNQETSNSLYDAFILSFQGDKKELREIRDIVTSCGADLPVRSLIAFAEICIEHSVVQHTFIYALYVKVLNICASLEFRDLCRAYNVLTACPFESLNMPKLARRVNEVIRSPKMQKRSQLYDHEAANLLFNLMLYDGTYPEDLLKNLMISANSGRHRSQAIFNVDVMLEVLYPHYKGERLSAEIRKELYEEYFGIEGKLRVKHESGTSLICRQYTEWIDQFKCALNNQMDHFMVTQVVPSSGYSDIVICVDKEGSFVPLPKELLEYKPWEVKRIPQCVRNDGKNLIVFTLTSSRISTARYQHAKMRLLKELGYDIARIRWSHWVDKDKGAYLLKLLDSLRI